MRAHLALAAAAAVVASASPPPEIPAAGYYDAVLDCGADPTGSTDSTAALNACIVASYAFMRPNNTYRGVAPVFLPLGTYLITDTVNLIQQNPGPDDGINVCPSRYLPIVLMGSAAALPARPTLVLAANASGYGNAASFKAVVYSNPGGVAMNDIFRGIDIDLTRPGNPGAVGLAMAGAQGASAHDVTVRAVQGAADAYGNPPPLACFLGANGAGGEHANVACVGARYGFLVDSGPLQAQPVPAIVGATFVNQSISAVSFSAQETLSIVGATIVQPAWATGPAITAPTGDDMSIVDVQVACVGGSANAPSSSTSSSSSVAVSSSGGALYVSNLYVTGCAASVNRTGSDNPPSVPGPSPSSGWMRTVEYAKGQTSSQWFDSDVTYINLTRSHGNSVAAFVQLPQGGSPPPDLLSRHVWDEASFPHKDAAWVADAKRDCGAKGDDTTDDAAALQSCLDTHTFVFLPPGRFRVSATIRMPPGGALVGMGNGISIIVASTTGLAGASPTNPVPLLATSDQDGPGSGVVNGTIFAFVGLTIFQHLPDTYALDWASRNPASLWRVGYESRVCECLWTTGWQTLSPPAMPCSLPVNITVPKVVFRGLGRIHAFVEDSTGGILSTSAAYRHMVVRDTAAFASADARTRFYALNLEHAQSEANAEIANASFVDIYSLKSEGNIPILWVRGDAQNVSVLAFGGGISPFAYNFTFPPDFTPALPSIFRIDEGAGAKFACLIDHGYGARAPYWPPSGGGCAWSHHYPYPGAAVPAYPFSTYPNATMWNCWYGVQVATSFWHDVVWGPPGDVAAQTGTAFTEKPILLTTYPQ
jgi:hypothetical protein